MSLAPLAEVPVTAKALEAEVRHMEHMVDLLRRRDAAQAELTQRGMETNLASLTPAEVIDIVAERHRISPDEIRSRRKTQDVYLARHEVFYLLSLQVKPDGKKRWSLTQIGRRVRGLNEDPFDHTTVLNGIRRHTARLKAEVDGVPLPPVVRSTGTGQKPRAARNPSHPQAPATVCELPCDAKCPWCGAEAGAPCNDGARRG